eukprot:UC1_evm2s221
MVETVSSIKVANKLQAGCEKHGRDTPLKVLLQVNTSGEEAKGGVGPEQVEPLARHIIDSCPLLELSGIMTIGARTNSQAEDAAEHDNPDFICLRDVRTDLAAALGRNVDSLELSMGMSSDFEHAISLGSTSVRVGSTIFGARAYPPKK